MFSRGFRLLALAAALVLPLWAQMPDDRAPASTQPSADSQATQPSSDSQTQPPASDTQTAQPQDNTPVEPMAQTPTFRVNVVERSTQAVDYRDRGGTTKIQMRGTDLMPAANGDVKVTGHTGRLALNTSLHGMKPARSLGPQYLTYVLWAITPQGRPVNLGEVIPNDDGNADLQLTTALQAFGLVVTAEPYFAVTRPSDMVVAENQIPADVKGWGPLPINAKYELMRPAEYTTDINPQQLPATSADVKKVPLQLLEAQNAVAIAQADGAAQYAPDVLDKAKGYLDRATDYYNRKQGVTPIGTMARAATQAAEDARLLTLDKKQQERAAAARKALQDKVTSAQSEADAARDKAELARLNAAQEAEQRQRAEAEREAAQRAAEQAEQARLTAEQEAQAAQQQLQSTQQQAEQARLQAQQAEQESLRAQQQAQQVQQAAQQQRERLLQQLNQVLQTKDTARGLVSRMPDVLFDVNKATLKPDAKIRLARVAGILLAYPDLKLEIDGYTDSTGTRQRNEQLSEQRAATVRDFLIAQGVPVNNVVARGFGPDNPIASNATTRGRQQNRRVEVVVSGQAIGQNTVGQNMAPGSPANPATGGTSGAAAGVSGNVGAGGAGASAGVGANTGASGAGASGTAGATTSAPPAQQTPPSTRPPQMTPPPR